MKVALIIPYHNRVEYLKKCLASIEVSDMPKDLFLLVINDASTDCETFSFSDYPNIDKITREEFIFKENKGIKGVLKYGFERCFSIGYDIVISLDSDAIVVPDFFKKIIELRLMFSDNIVCGINSTNYDNGKLRNPIVLEHDKFILKKFANGQCLCLNKSAYNRFVKDALAVNGNWDYNASLATQKANISVSVPKPSLVQHIGVLSSMSHIKFGEPDIALDFPKIKIPNVTLFGVDAHDPSGILRASEISQRHIQFGAVKIITERIFDGRDGYSTFCINEMWKHIETDFVLVIHADGYIQNAWAWDEDFLNYDYIGASWAYKDNMNVGNGGFTLRSKKLLNAIKDFNVPNGTIEDDFICRKIRRELEVKHGIKFAPEEVANRFSIEAYGAGVFTDMQGHKANTYTGQLGFHGYSVLGLPILPTPKIPTPKTKPTKTVTKKVTHKRTFRR